jgi:hypothetical protein
VNKGAGYNNFPVTKFKLKQNLFIVSNVKDDGKDIKQLGVRTRESVVIIFI